MSGPVVVVLHGPAGVGKDSLIAGVRERADVHRATSCATRAPREGEVDGVDYHFMTPERFEEKIAAGEFIEYAEVYKEYKGLERSELEEALTRGQDVIIRTDLQGVRSWRKLLPAAVTVLLTDDIEAIRRRLEERGTEDPAKLAIRLEEADEEVADGPNNDYVVFNRHGKLEAAVEEFLALLERERKNPDRAAVVLPGARTAG